MLAPARQWEGFGDLNVTVRVPAGWSVATRPDSRRQGDTLSGHFDGIPGDAVGITTRMPLPADWTQAGGIASLLVVVVVSLITGFALGRRFGWPGALGSVGIIAPTLAFLSAVVIAVVVDAKQNALPDGQRSWFGAKGTGFVWLWYVRKHFS